MYVPTALNQRIKETHKPKLCFTVFQLMMTAPPPILTPAVPHKPGSQPFLQCQICRKSFINEQDLYNHYDSAHQRNATWANTCAIYAIKDTGMGSVWGRTCMGRMRKGMHRGSARFARRALRGLRAWRCIWRSIIRRRKIKEDWVGRGRENRKLLKWISEARHVWLHDIIGQRRQLYE